MGSHPGGEEPATGGGRSPAGAEAALLAVLVRLSRARWLLDSVANWLPPSVRAHAEEAAELLEDAIADLRRYAADQGSGPIEGPGETD